MAPSHPAGGDAEDRAASHAPTSTS
jgi:hypothetical protein